MVLRSASGLRKKICQRSKKHDRQACTPYAHAIRYEKFRIIHTDIFPFSVHFYINNVTNQIVIVGVVHDSKDSAFIKIRE